MNRYMAYMWPALLKRASHPVIMGSAVALSVETLGIEDKYREWDAAGLMRYRSRRALMEIVANLDQADSHEFKMAALVKTIAFPVETQINLGDPRFSLALILLSSTLVITRIQDRSARR